MAIMPGMGTNPLAAIKSMGLGNMIAVPVAIKVLMYVKYKIYTWIVQVRATLCLQSVNNLIALLQEYEVFDHAQREAISLFFASHPSRLDKYMSMNVMMDRNSASGEILQVRNGQGVSEIYWRLLTAIMMIVGPEVRNGPHELHNQD